MDDELIQLRGVDKRFGRKVVLDCINLSIPEQKITGIIGASGEGKTTILKMIIGFYKPNKGDVLYSKRTIKNDLKNIKKIFGFATEDGSFHERLTVYENLIHFGRLHHIKKSEIKKRAEKLMDLVGLREAKDRLARDLSMGMKKRLDVAISLIHNPKVLIMDEPTADLDPLLRDNMLKLIKRINSNGTTIILTTQLLGEMDRICDKIAILFERKIIDEGEPNKIKSKYNAQDLDGVFNRIFSKKTKPEDKIKTMERQIEQELKEEEIENEELD